MSEVDDEDEFTPRDDDTAVDELPEEIPSWNWGAFFLSWIWGLGNRTYIALVTLVFPLMPFILGFMGNKWAWRNKEWDDVDHFLAVQKRWSIAGFVVFLLFVFGITGTGFWYQKHVSSSDIYKTTLNQIAEDPKALEPIGGAFRPGWYVISDHVPLNPRPDRFLEFPIAGPKGKGMVRARAERDGGRWELTSIAIDVVGRGQPVEVRLPKQLIRKALAEGDASLAAGDGEAAAAHYQAASELNSSEAAYKLGEMFADGTVVETDYEKAKRWLELAVSRGYRDAGAKLEEVRELAPPELTAAEKRLLAEAEQLESIRERLSATDAAIAELEQLAERGNAEAQLFYADLLHSGIGPSQSFSMAAMWYRRAAEAGNADAQFMLGTLYLRGNALPRSVESATEWLSKAAEQDHEKARMELRLIGKKVAERKKDDQ